MWSRNLWLLHSRFLAAFGVHFPFTHNASAFARLSWQSNMALMEEILEGRMGEVVGGWEGERRGWEDERVRGG